MTHYAPSQHPKTLKKAARILCDLIREKAAGQRPILCYCGFSGIAIATAISLEMYADDVPHGMIYVRKMSERGNCHGKDIEHNIPILSDGSPPSILVFVDDFIVSGDTRTFVMDEVIQFMNGMKTKLPTIGERWAYERDRMIVATVGAIEGPGDIDAEYNPNDTSAYIRNNTL